MSGRTADVALVVPAVPDSIAVIRQTVSGVCEALGADPRVIGDVKLAKSSTNSFVDDACVDAAKLTGKVPPPPPSRHGMRIQCIK